MKLEDYEQDVRLSVADSKSLILSQWISQKFHVLDENETFKIYEEIKDFLN